MCPLLSCWFYYIRAVSGYVMESKRHLCAQIRCKRQSPFPYGGGLPSAPSVIMVVMMMKPNDQILKPDEAVVLPLEKGAATTMRLNVPMPMTLSNKTELVVCRCPRTRCRPSTVGLQRGIRGHSQGSTTKLPRSPTCWAGHFHPPCIQIDHKGSHRRIQHESAIGGNPAEDCPVRRRTRRVPAAPDGPAHDRSTRRKRRVFRRTPSA